MTGSTFTGTAVSGITHDYATLAQVKADIPDSPLSDTTDSSYNTVLTVMISAASRLIDKEVGRWEGYFYPTTDGETRYFDGSGEIEQDIDECISLTSVSVSESGEVANSTGYTAWTEGTDYYVWPYNYSGLEQPILKLVIDWNSDKSTWTRYRKAVKVTGIFGYSLTPPEDVTQACKIQAMRWYMRAKQAYQDAGTNAEIGQMYYMQQLDPDVKEILRHYQLSNMI